MGLYDFFPICGFSTLLNPGGNSGRVLKNIIEKVFWL